MRKVTVRMVRNKLGQIYVSIFERTLTNTKWFNPWLTFYLNIRCVPLRQAFRFPVFVYGWPKIFSTFGHIRFPEKCYPGMVHFNETVSGGPQCEVGNSELNLWGTIIFRGKCTVGTSNKLCVGLNGILDLGDETKITILCNITSCGFVKVGHHSWIVHRCQILDTNYHFVADFRHEGFGRVHPMARPIKIGDYCWICNSATVTGGAVIPNKTMVASNSLVSKDLSSVPEESLVGGIPAKLLATGLRRVEKGETEIFNYFREHPDATSFEFPIERKNDFM